MVHARIDLGAFRTTLASLQDGLEVVQSPWFKAQTPQVQNTLIAGVIQNFEFVYEIGFKTLRRRLEIDAAVPTEVDALGFRDLLRRAAEQGLIDEVESWFRYRELRNITAHTYDSARAHGVYLQTVEFIRSATSLLERLEARNG